MLTKKQIQEIKTHLENSQNPLFFFDNDPDGLCSFLLLRRFLGRGKGVAVKGTPMTNEYFRKVRELEPDYIFILDKPIVAKDFYDDVWEINTPIVVIDHHETEKSFVPEFVNYYNSFSKKKKSSEPVTFISYKIANNRNDLWLAVVGCISDNYIPSFYKTFLKMYPDLGLNSKKAFDLLYGSQIGKISQLFSAGLKDRTTNVLKMLKFLVNVKSPYEVLEETNENSLMYGRFNELNKKYLELLSRAKVNTGEKILFFKYSGETSMTSELANNLSYHFPEKIIIVAYVKGESVNLSIRGKNIKNKILELLNKIETATGGGHDNAIGAKMSLKDLDKFVEDLKNIS
jgi:single-stranded DNA-specific DHH superfamily exonuclease